MDYRLDHGVSMSVPLLMPRHEIWRLEYRQNRYARHLSQPALAAASPS